MRLNLRDYLIAMVIFFHVTCHVDQTLKTKIRNGEFIKLERLLPKDKGSVAIGNGSEDMDFRSFIQAIAKGGSTYVGPGLDTHHRDRKTGSIRKWEQAFRVYAAIYTEFHPERAAEIWQYVYTINTAASTFSWDNVYYSDGSKGGHEGCTLPPWPKISSFSCSFREKLAK